MLKINPGKRAATQNIEVNHKAKNQTEETVVELRVQYGRFRELGLAERTLNGHAINTLIAIQHAESHRQSVMKNLKVIYSTSVLP